MMVSFTRFVGAIVLVVGTVAACAPCHAKEIDVSDTASLRNAIELLAGGKARAGDNVDRLDIVLRAGVYRVDTPLQLMLDGTWRGTPITITGPPSGRAVISGARVVAGFAPVQDPAVLSRLPVAARDKVLVADLSQNGVTDLGTFERHGFGIPTKPAPLELFYRGQPMMLARWPASGFATIEALPDGPRGSSFILAGAHVAVWKDEPDLHAFGYWARDWADATLSVESVDPASQRITLAAPAPMFGMKVGQRVFIENALSELSQPGEYYVDGKTSHVYFWPPRPLKDGDVEVSVADSLFETNGVIDLTLRDLTFDMARGDAVRLQGGGNLALERLTVRNAGNRAIVSTASNVRMHALDIENTGEGGIVIFAGDRNRLVAGNVVVSDSTFHDYARRSRAYRPAISVSGVGDRIEHNVIHDGPHAAIIFTGNDHVIARNDIYRVATETADTGAIYTGRDWTARGTVIEDNFLHDIGNATKPQATMGVYLDDQASGITIRRNVFSRVNQAVFIGGGRDNIVEDNLFANCSPAVYIDSRGLSWQRGFANSPNGVLRSQLVARRVNEPPYSTRYPSLATLLSDEPGAPKGIVLARNVVIGGKALSIDGGAQRYVQLGPLFGASDVVFAKAMPDAARRSLADLQISHGSPALARGFKVPAPVLDTR
jgi:Right handed beta helix region